MEEYKCTECDRDFNSEDSLRMHNNAKHQEAEKAKPIASKIPFKKIRNYAIVIAVLLLLVWGFYAMGNRKVLPPKTMEGHIEVHPGDQISLNPLDPRIHKHILEHVGEEGSRAGIVVNYDCKNYECDPDLIEKLENLTEGNNFVFVGPFKNMKAKIVLTKLNQQITLDEYNDVSINNFIR